MNEHPLTLEQVTLDAITGLRASIVELRDYRTVDRPELIEYYRELARFLELDLRVKGALSNKEGSQSAETPDAKPFQGNDVS